MKRFLSAILLAFFLGVCAPAHAASTLLADNVIRVEFQYSDPMTPIAMETYGPATAQFPCTEDVMAQPYPAGTIYHNTCLEVALLRPAPHGQVVVQPSAYPINHPIAVALVAVEYGRDAEWVGAQALHIAANLRTCQVQAPEIIADNYKSGAVPQGASLLIYCVGVPKGSVIERGDTESTSYVHTADETPPQSVRDTPSPGDKMVVVARTADGAWALDASSVQAQAGTVFTYIAVKQFTTPRKTVFGMVLLFSGRIAVNCSAREDVILSIAAVGTHGEVLQRASNSRLTPQALVPGSPGASIAAVICGTFSKEPDETVTYKDPCPYYPFPGAGACQISTRREL